jgi:hypothetical protein
MDRHEKAEWLDRGAKLASSVGPMLGPKGAVIGPIVGSVLGAVADLLRDQDVSTEELVERLKPLPDLKPWKGPGS